MSSGNVRSDEDGCDTTPAHDGRKPPLRLAYNRSDTVELLSRRAIREAARLHRQPLEKMYAELIEREARDHQRMRQLRQATSKLAILAAVLLVSAGLLLSAVFSIEIPDRPLLVAGLSLVVGLAVALTAELIRTSVPKRMDHLRLPSGISALVQQWLVEASHR